MSVELNTLLRADEPQTPSRLAALDALRGAAMLLGVCLHASVSYMAGKMPGLVWGVYDKSQSSAFDMLFWWIHGFRLPLFFFIAGFFAVVVYDSRGLAGFLGHRCRRLLAPLVAGCLLILPVCYYVWSMGWLISARCSIKQILAVRFSPEIQEELFGPLHLWFLEDLFVMSVVFGVLRYCATGRNLSLKERLTAYTQSPKVLAAAPFALSICSAGLLSLNLEAVFAYHNAALPPPARLLYYGFYFFVGVCMALARGRLNAASGAWPFHLALSVPAGLGMLALLTKYLEVGGSVWERLALGGCTALFAWLSTFGWLGFCLRWFDGQRPTIRYLADASYWIYLIHLPVVAFAQLTFHALPIPQVAKFLLVVGITLTLGLLSYSSMIRYTWVGNWLNGPRQRPRPAQPITTEHKLAA